MNSSPIPPAPDEGSPLTLPELNQALLDWLEIERLLRDIEQCTQIDEILPKLAPQGYAPENRSLSLAEARELLQRRTVRGMQFRYRYDNAEWWDTIMIVGDHYRLVRIRHDFTGTTPSPG